MIEHLDKKVVNFICFFHKEMAVMEQKIAYNIFYDFLNTAMRRIKLFVLEDLRFLEENKRKEYLDRIAVAIKKQAMSYNPVDGSAWESLGNDLEKLAEEAREDKIKPYQLFVVVAWHNTGHGECETAIQATESLLEAVGTARKAEELDYQFYGEDTGISVYSLEMKRKYQKREFEFYCGKPPKPNYPVVMRRYKRNGEWKEEWFCEDSSSIVIREN